MQTEASPSKQDETNPHVRVACIGYGYRGQYLLRVLSAIPTFRIVAIADPAIGEDNPYSATVYNCGEQDYNRMLATEQVDLVIVASPWQWHVEHAMTCVVHHCHVALEIKGGLYIGEYSPLMASAKQNNVKLFPLENTLFMREVMSLTNMIAKGILGNIIYMRGGYRHDIRHILIDDNGTLGGRKGTESEWRATIYKHLNADLYPSHGIAPLCLMAGINKTDWIESICSFASSAHGLKNRIAELGGDADTHIATGDVVVSQLQTQKGILITLTHDTTLPRPKSLDFEVQGTKGIWQGDRRMIYIEGVSPLATWEDDEPYIAQHEHPFWLSWGKDALQHDAHHQGMDYMMLKAIEQDILQYNNYPATIVDLALWTSITPLSAESIAKGNIKVTL